MERYGIRETARSAWEYHRHGSRLTECQGLERKKGVAETEESDLVVYVLRCDDDGDCG